MRQCLLAVLALALSSSIAAAQSMPDAQTLLDLGNRLASQATTASDQSGFTVTYQMNVNGDEKQRALYGMHSALQALDVMTTTAALAAGHREANPLLGGGGAKTLLIAKSAAMGFHLYAVQRLEKRRPKLAMWTMVAINAALCAVVANNAAIASR